MQADPNQQRGEMVLVVQGWQGSPDGADQIEAERVLRLLMEQGGLPVKKAPTLPTPAGRVGKGLLGYNRC